MQLAGVDAARWRSTTLAPRGGDAARRPGGAVSPVLDAIASSRGRRTPPGARPTPTRSSTASPRTGPRWPSRSAQVGCELTATSPRAAGKPAARARFRRAAAGLRADAGRAPVAARRDVGTPCRCWRTLTHASRGAEYEAAATVVMYPGQPVAQAPRSSPWAPGRARPALCAGERARINQLDGAPRGTTCHRPADPHDGAAARTLSFGWPARRPATSRRRGPSAAIEAQRRAAGLRQRRRTEYARALGRL